MLGKNLGLIKSIFGLVRAVSTRVALETEMVGRLFPNTCDALAIIRPETVMRWHRRGFRSYWRWKSSRRPGRPAVSFQRVPVMGRAIFDTLG
jgi:hypothetical protein